MLFNSKKSGFKLLSLLFVVGLTFAACSQDVDGQIGNLQDQIDDVRSNLDKEIAARSEAIQKLQSQLEALQATHAADIKKLQDADAKLSQAIADAEKAAEEFASAEADAAEAAAKAYADAQDKVILATAEAAAAEAEANAKAYTEAQIATLKAQLEKELADAVKALDDKYAAEVAALKAKDADLEKSVEAAKADLEKAIEAAKAELNKKIGDEIARIEAAHKADIKRIDDAIAALEGRVSSIEAWETTAKTQIAANETAIATLKGDLSKEVAAREAGDKALQTALNALGADLDAKYQELKKADDALYAAIVDNAKKIKDLQDADVELGKRIDGVVADLEAAQKAIQAEIDKIYKQIGDLFDKYDALNKALVAAIDNQAKVNGDLKAKDEAQDKALEAAVAALQQAIADAIAQAKEDQAVVDAAQDQALQAAIAQFEDALAAAVAAQAAIDADQDAALQDAIAAFNAGLDEVFAALQAAIDAQAGVDAAQDEANAEKFAAVYAALSAAVDEQATVDAAQDAALEAARLALEGAIASAKSELEGKISAAVTKAENELQAAKKELQDAIDTLDAKLSAAIKVLAGTPTTLIFKPIAYRNGIETVVFEPVFYVSMENASNDEVDFNSIENSTIHSYQAFDFQTPLEDYDPYVQNTDVDDKKNLINKVDWIKSYTHYVNLPAEVHYFVNPSNASIKDLKLNYPDVQFLGNVAEVAMTRGYSEENEDVAGLIALNYNSHYTNAIENQTLKFRIDLVSQAVDGHDNLFPVGTTDFANNENGKISFGWPTFADFGGKQNPNYYSGRVDAGYDANWWGWFCDNSAKEEVLDKIRNSKVTFRGNYYWFVDCNENSYNQSYVFATQIPFAGNDENVKGKTVVSDYAQVAVEGAFAQFALVTKGSNEEYLNPNKHDAYVLQGNEPGEHKPINVGTVEGDNGKTVVYDLYAGEENGVPYGFDWNQSYKLTDFIDLLEGDEKYNWTNAVYNVDAMRMEDLGFQYRFYVPMAKASAKTKNVDLWGDMVKEFGHENYLGPNFGPYEYYFGDSKIDFQDYLEVNAKTGEIKILKPEVSKGFTPVVLAQVIDTRRPYSPVVTEAYFRLVIKGEEVKGEMEAFDFPACDKPDVEVPVDAAWFKTNVYDKFSTNNSKFNYYFNATIKEATPNTYFVWRRWKDEKHTEAITIGKFQWDGKKVVWDEDLLSIYPISSYKDTDFLVMCTPFKDLVGKMSETAIDNKTQITWTLGGNVVTLDLNAKAALPVIQLAYSDSYWDGAVLPKHGDANFFATIIANPNPASEQSSEKYCSFDFDLTTGFNHFQKPTGYAQDAATKIYYKATFDGRDVSKEVDGCYTFDIVPARHNLAFDTPEWFGYAQSDKFRYSFNTAESTYLELGEKVNGKPYYDYEPALWYRDGSSYGYYNVLLKEAQGRSHTPALSSIEIDTPWGFEKGIDLLEKDMDVPCLVFATYHGGDEYTESLVIEQFKLDYKKPIIVTNKQAKPFEFVDITHTDQIIKTTDVVALTDWLGNPVKAEKVAIIHTHGKFTPEELSAYYNVDNPYFVADQDGNPVYKTDLKVNANGTYTHQCVVNFDEDGNIESIGTPTGTLPDKTVLKFAEDGNIYYQNAGASLDQDYHIFVEVEVPHKWGVAKGYVVITVKSNKK